MLGTGRATLLGAAGRTGIQFIGATGDTATNQGGVTLAYDDIPNGGVKAGDLLVIAAVRQYNQSVTSTPAGYSQKTASRPWTFERTADGSEPGATVTAAGGGTSGRGYAILAVYRGVVAGAAGVDTAEPDDDTVTAPSVASLGGGHYAAWTRAGLLPAAYPNGFDVAYELDGLEDLVVAHMLTGVSDPTGAAVVLSSNSGTDTRGGASIALDPA